MVWVYTITKIDSGFFGIIIEIYSFYLFYIFNFLHISAPNTQNFSRKFLRGTEPKILPNIRSFLIFPKLGNFEYISGTALQVKD